MLSQALSLTSRQTIHPMENIALYRNYYYKITRGDQGYFFGLYAGPDKRNLDRPMFLYSIFQDKTLRRSSSITVERDWMIEPISHDDWKFLMRVLISNMYYFEQGLGVKPMRAPVPGRLVYFYNIETDLSGFGIYMEGTKDTVSMCAYISSDKVYFEDMRYEIGNTGDIYFRTTTRIEEDNFNKVLSSYGKQWVFAVRRVIPTNDYRGKKGSVYYYINDRYTISHKTDTWAGTDTSRFYAGNYFLSIDEAMEVLRQVAPVFAIRQASIVSGQTKPEKQVINERFLIGDDGKLVKRRRGRPGKEE